MFPGIRFQSANKLREFDKLKTGCKEIDSILKGGFKTNILNEIVGCSGSGKTQICLILSLMVQLPRELGGFGKASVYICTEDVFPVKRLHELSLSFLRKYGLENSLDNVFICHIPDYDRLKTVLNVFVPSLVRAKKVGLLVIDSIAGVFRSDNQGISYVNRSKQFNEIALKLREFATKLNCVVICVNQVTEDISTGKTEPCLGLSWSNLVNSRFFINRQYPSKSRTFQIAFASDIPNSLCNFLIDEEGLVS
ncbi:hypothetical protein HHI36_004310 [Cryptolaemus montrouzieri]|uniref:RecA family profile 1 domain-containing protein n=1 Tax=Cryptolaemus montrouzieri TaxID=559131 RepID=A0ABD2NQT3_9CUCU